MQQQQWQHQRPMQQLPMQQQKQPPQTQRNVATFQQQLKKWTRERNEVQRDVALHVSWLDDLRKELTDHCYGGGSGASGGGILGGGGAENYNPNLSRTANALLSPRVSRGTGGAGEGSGSRSILKNKPLGGELYPREV